MTRLVLCQGKIYYDIVGHEDRARATSVAVARIEQLYPFPVEQAAALVRGYPNLREVVWAQEEPQNMGAWRPIRHRLEEAKPEGVPLLYVGRPWRASPSEGYPTAHLREQDRIVRAALAPSALSWLASRSSARGGRAGTARASCAAFGPCLRASLSASLRCRGESRRQTSYIAIATPIGPGRSLPRRAMERV